MKNTDAFHAHQMIDRFQQVYRKNDEMLLEAIYNFVRQSIIFSDDS